MFRIERLTEYDFFRMSGQWNTLLESSSTKNFFLSWEWLSHWWRHFGKGKELLLLAFYDNAALSGIAPLYREKKLFFKHLPLWRVGFLGTDTVYSDYLDIIAKQGQEKRIASCLLKYFSEGDFQWDLLELTDMLKGSPTLLCIEETARTLPYHISSKDAEVYPYLSLPDSVLKYQSELRKKTRYDIRRGTKDLVARFGQSNVVLRRSSSTDAHEKMSDQLLRLFSLHRTRWAVRRGKSSFGLEQVERFHVGLLADLLKNQTVTMFSLEIQEEACAVIYGFTYGGKYYFYQSGFDPGFKSYNPGLIVVNFAIEKAIEGGLAEYDFLRGDEAYKSKFTKTFRQSCHLQIWNNEVKRRYTEAFKIVYAKAKQIARNVTALNLIPER